MKQRLEWKSWQTFHRAGIYSPLFRVRSPCWQLRAIYVAARHVTSNTAFLPTCVFVRDRDPNPDRPLSIDYPEMPESIMLVCRMPRQSTRELPNFSPFFFFHLAKTTGTYKPTCVDRKPVSRWIVIVFDSLYLRDSRSSP